MSGDVTPEIKHSYTNENCLHRSATRLLNQSCQNLRDQHTPSIQVLYSSRTHTTSGMSGSDW